jgi:F-type H+-transporting ATPase subunit alpha
MELFKQIQYEPIPVEIQAVVLWSMQNNFLDDVPVEKVKDFQSKLTEYMQTRKNDLLAKVRKEKAINDALAAELKSALTDFKQTYR